MEDTRSTSAALGIDYIDIKVDDIKVDAGEKAPLRFTFFRLKDKRWEHTDYMVWEGAATSLGGRDPSESAR